MVVKTTHNENDR